MYMYMYKCLCLVFIYLTISSKDPVTAFWQNFQKALCKTDFQVVRHFSFLVPLLC